MYIRIHAAPIKRRHLLTCPPPKSDGRRARPFGLVPILEYTDEERAADEAAAELWAYQCSMDERVDHLYW
jgi:hypothetical protein